MTSEKTEGSGALPSRKIIRDPATEPSIREMQDMYLKRKGRMREFNENSRREMERTGKTKAQVRQKILEQMGLSDREELISEYRENLTTVQQKVKEEEAIRELVKERNARRQSEYERAFSELPSDAAPAVILKWIENHPAMALREVPDSGFIELTVEDLENAPSRSAVGQLRHWVNRKDEFYKAMIGASKKAVGSGDDGDGSGASQVDPTVEEIEKMLDAYGC